MIFFIRPGNKVFVDPSNDQGLLILFFLLLFVRLLGGSILGSKRQARGEAAKSFGQTQTPRTCSQANSLLIVAFVRCYLPLKRWVY